MDGLFSQSSLGVVTRLSVWLMPAPESFQAFFFMCSNEEGLGSIIDALRPLRMNGTLRSVMHIGNDYKVLAATSQFPWQEVDARPPLDRAAMANLRSKLKIACWTGSGGLYGTRPQVREARVQLRRALSGKVDRLQFLDDRSLRWLGRMAKPLQLLTGRNLHRTLKAIAPVYGLLKGIPTQVPLASVYWRKKTPVPAAMDPDRDACGLLWCCPVLPATGRHALEVTQLAKDILLNRGFEPQISISLATERTLICVITLSYDRGVAGEDERADACYKALTEQLVARGYPPYRLNVRSMQYVDAHQGYASALRALKVAFDPNGILAPGRYSAAPPVPTETVVQAK